MFSKPLNLILVYLLTLFNLVILCSPLIAVILPFLNSYDLALIIQNGWFAKISFAFFVICFSVSFLMIFYLVIDFIFGFSVKSSLKGAVPYEKIKDYDFLTSLFDQAKAKFGEKNVKLYIKNSNEINAFAVSSLTRKAIVITSGLIDHFLEKCDEPKDFLYALRSVIGHEMSHLVNKDFLPGFLIIINQRATNFVSAIVLFLFNFFLRISARIPSIGPVAAVTIKKSYYLVTFILTAFNRFIVFNIYEFLRRFISRSIEYRCDNQSARAFGGKNMKFALSLLGEDGYFTLFSTHPRTKSRMAKVENIKITDSIIKPRFFDSLSNYFSVMFLLVICLFFAKKAHIDIFVREFIRNHELINQKLLTLWHLVAHFF